MRFLSGASNNRTNVSTKNYNGQTSNTTWQQNTSSIFTRAPTLQEKEAILNGENFSHVMRTLIKTLGKHAVEFLMAGLIVIGRLNNREQAYNEFLEAIKQFNNQLYDVLTTTRGTDGKPIVVSLYILGLNRSYMFIQEFTCSIYKVMIDYDLSSRRVSIWIIRCRLLYANNSLHNDDRNRYIREEMRIFFESLPSIKNFCVMHTTTYDNTMINQPDISPAKCIFMDALEQFDKLGQVHSYSSHRQHTKKTHSRHIHDKVKCRSKIRKNTDNSNTQQVQQVNTANSKFIGKSQQSNDCSALSNSKIKKSKFIPTLIIDAGKREDDSKKPSTIKVLSPNLWSNDNNGDCIKDQLGY